MTPLMDPTQDIINLEYENPYSNLVEISDILEQGKQKIGKKGMKGSTTHPNKLTPHKLGFTNTEN